jgi:hypothetical protein
VTLLLNNPFDPQENATSPRLCSPAASQLRGDSGRLTSLMQEPEATKGSCSNYPDSISLVNAAAVHGNSSAADSGSNPVTGANLE